MKGSKSISKRGKKASTTELRTDMELFFEASNNLWTSKNPSGKFPLNMAENNLNWNLMAKKIENVLRKQALPKWVSNYTGIGGEENYLKAIAHFLNQHVTNCEISIDHIATSAGATAVIELASWVMCDKGDVAVIPAPSYPVYTQDIGNKSGVKRHDLITHKSISKIKDGPALKIKHLKSAKERLEKKGKKFRMLIITSPDNPTGNIYSEKKLNKIADWCIKHKIHLVVNELYALSLINSNKSNKRHSFADIMASKKSDYLHSIYGLSKDFGMSGFRVGIFHSLNDKIMSAYRNLNAPHMVSNLTQFVVTNILSDDKFIKDYIAINQSSISRTFSMVSKTLDKLNIEYVNSKGSLFVWLDLSKYLKKKTSKSEIEFWLKLYKETGILLTPAAGFGNARKGQFRLVHTFLSPSALKEAMKRFAKFITQQKK